MTSKAQGFGLRAGAGAAICLAWLLAGAPASLAAAAGPAAPANTTALAPALSPQAEAIRIALEQAQPGVGASEKALLAAVRSFYESRGFEPAWLVAGHATRQMSGLRRRMDSAAIYGLDPAAYRTPSFALDIADGSEASADVEFSRAAARFVTHLASGRLDPAAVSPIITLKPERPDVGDALTRLTQTASISLALARLEPPEPEYRALKAKLAELDAAGKAEDGEVAVTVPQGASLKPGGTDARVPLLRTRLGLAAADGDPNLYDPALVEAVKSFQATGGLTPDGILGPRSIVALNGVNSDDDRSAVLANMERWRWMPRDLGAFHVFVNVPQFTVRVVKDGETVHETRVVVGAPNHRTPTFSSAISFLVVNPYWNVPTSIISKEMLPEIQRDPYGYFARHGYQVMTQSGGRTRVVDPDSIDWWMVNPRSVRIRQLPGDANALGRIKFMFPNQHDVYLHDTPSKSLFKKDFRAFSHGCVRVDNPLEFADALLAVASPNWNSRRLEKLYGGPERRVDLQHSIPVHLAYFTMEIAPSGKVRRFADVYGYDEKMRALLAPADKQVASISP